MKGSSITCCSSSNELACVSNSTWSPLLGCCIMLFSLVAKNQDPLGLQRLKAVLDTHVVFRDDFSAETYVSESWIFSSTESALK